MSVLVRLCFLIAALSWVSAAPPPHQEVSGIEAAQGALPVKRENEAMEGMDMQGPPKRQRSMQLEPSTADAAPPPHLEVSGIEAAQGAPIQPVRPKKKRPPCPHGKPRYLCKDCGATGICEHDRQRRQCKDCGGSSICEHGRQRTYAIVAVVASVVHRRQRSTCKDCGGSSIY